MDPHLNDPYTIRVEQLSRILSLLAALAALIACLDVFALTMYTIDQRTKERGVRKVLGASAASARIGTPYRERIAH